MLHAPVGRAGAEREALADTGRPAARLGAHVSYRTRRLASDDEKRERGAPATGRRSRGERKGRPLAAGAGTRAAARSEAGQRGYAATVWVHRCILHTRKLSYPF